MSQKQYDSSSPSSSSETSIHQTERVLETFGVHALMDEYFEKRKKERRLEKFAMFMFKVGLFFSPVRFLPLPPFNFIASLVSNAAYAAGYSLWNRAVRADLSRVKSSNFHAGDEKKNEEPALSRGDSKFLNAMRMHLNREHKKLVRYRSCIASGVIAVALGMTAIFLTGLAAIITAMASITIFAMSNILWARGARQELKFQRETYQELQKTYEPTITRLKTDIDAIKATQDPSAQVILELSRLEHQLSLYQAELKKSKRAYQAARSEYRMHAAVATSSSVVVTGLGVGFGLQLAGMLNFNAILSAGASALLSIPVIGWAVAASVIVIGATGYLAKKYIEGHRRSESDKIELQRYKSARPTELRQATDARRCSMARSPNHVHSAEEHQGTPESTDEPNPLYAYRRKMRRHNSLDRNFRLPVSDDSQSPDTELQSMPTTDADSSDDEQKRRPRRLKTTQPKMPGVN